MKEFKLDQSNAEIIIYSLWAIVLALFVWAINSPTIEKNVTLKIFKSIFKKQVEKELHEWQPLSISIVDA